MKKIRLFLPLILLMFCGWTGNYSLEYKGNSFVEKIDISSEESFKTLAEKYSKYEDGDFVETSIYYGKLSALIDKHYKKEFTNNYKNVHFEYEYSDSEFENNIQLSKCFENAEFIKDKDCYRINLSGDFYCEGYEINTFNLITNKNWHVRNNADDSNNGVYTWNIKEENNISIILYSHINYDKYAFLIIPAIVAVVAIICYVVYLRGKAVNKI